MPKDGKKAAAVGLGLVGIFALIYKATRAEAKPPSPPPGLANLYGKVTDATTGKAIPAVLVTLDDMQIYTDTKGNYIFDNLQLGAYALQFSKEGYETAIY